MASTITPDRIRLRDFVDDFTLRVERAADRIAQGQADPAIARNTVYWKLRAIPMAQRALLLEDDQAAALHLWLLSAAQVEVLKAAVGQHDFGDGQTIAVDAAEEIRAAAADVAGSLLTPEQFRAAGPRIEEFVAQHTDSSGFELTGDEARKWTQSMSAVLKKPFDLLQAPLSSLNPVSGLSDTALAVQNFTDQFTLARMHMADMPRELRWHAQLLMMEFEETARIAELVRSAEAVGDSAASLAATAERLPAEVRAELSGLLEEIDARQAGLQGTLAALDATLADAEATARALDAMGATWTGMFAGFTEVMATFEPDPDAPPKPEGEAGPPFDIDDYGRTAEKLTATAEALTVLLERADALAASDPPPPLLTDAEAMVRRLIDRALLGGAALVVFTALVAGLYRKAVGRRAAA